MNSHRIDQHPGNRPATGQDGTGQHGLRLLDGMVTAGRKGVAYDWQSVLAADGIVSIESALRRTALEPAE